MSKTGFSSAYDEGKGAYMHPVFFFLFQEIFNFHISTASNSSELLSEIKQILALLPDYCNYGGKELQESDFISECPSLRAGSPLRGVMQSHARATVHLKLRTCLQAMNAPKQKKKYELGLNLTFPLPVLKSKS